MTFATPAVLLPGTGSDEVFVRNVFAGPLSASGLELVAPRPPAGARLVDGYLEFLDTLDGPVVVGGVSFGAHLAASWAVRNPDRCAGLLVALPAAVGPMTGAPARAAARLTADRVDRDGLEAALAASVDGVRPWLAAELTRAWRRHGDGLAAALRVAVDFPAPSAAELRALRVPAGVAACSDDPVHPATVARRWAATLPAGRLRTTTLAAMGDTPEALGAVAVRAFLDASGHVKATFTT
ncbi:alpha/beta fold hydrolase [Amycolatopsis suaedae]|uniref:Alpha/beta hydrolase n=1 Tax=Amycolatopsis suaedae TaxID=2510978 RepID=A0A4Q7J7C8_9PSEU|nr:alpha/beta hydrolase [Amycolatopsis suaedae]RZQ63069.1 alpha/beta hydrolase [Amycolatopsis suaedae]